MRLARQLTLYVLFMRAGARALTFAFNMRSYCHRKTVCKTAYIRGASKIKVKNVNKKRMATARRLIFLEFLKASIADLITLFFS
jgi:hypothetical protein